MTLLALLTLAVAAAAAALYGAARWNAGTRELRARLEAARQPARQPAYDPAQLADLPPPVRRYLEAVLKDGQPMIAAVNVNHAGTFNTSETGEQWKPFTSTQRVTIQPPGFDWDGRVMMAPGLAVRVHDAYVDGEGILHASLLGLVTVAELRGTREVAEGELMRYLAESAWYPTALLPGHGVTWEAVGERSARATLSDRGTSVTLLFRFDPDGPIDSVRAEARGRTVGDSVVPTPWEGRWRGYAERHGIRVPSEGEVAWMMPEGPRPYWRGRITALEYEFAAAGSQEAAGRPDSAAPRETCVEGSRRTLGRDAVATGVRPPRKRHHVTPVFPRRDTPFRGEPAWIASVLIDTEGTVRGVWFEREPEFTPPWPESRDAVSDALRQWKFEPTEMNGEAVPVCLTVSVDARAGR